MTDRASQVAAFLVERPASGGDSAELWAEMRRRWPGLTPEEGRRGAKIAAEILAGTIAEKSVILNAVEAAFTRGEAAAVAGFGEAEFQEIADGTGIPLDAVREAMQVLQRGESLPLADSENEEDDDADRDR